MVGPKEAIECALSEQEMQDSFRARRKTSVAGTDYM
eukprot:SAG11_NODE_1101_length_5868_cov_2.045935_8_plen_36_part_00